MLLQLPDGSVVDPDEVALVRVIPRQDYGHGLFSPDTLVIHMKPAGETPGPTHTCTFGSHLEARGWATRIAEAGGA